MVRTRNALFAAAALLAGLLCQAAAVSAERLAFPLEFSPRLRMPGEFEHQDAILLAWDESDEPAQQTQIEMARAIWKRVPVIVLVNSAEAQRSAAEAFHLAGVSRRAVRFVRVAVDTVWARDYGPSALRSRAGSAALVNTEYERAERPNDDDVPLAIAPLLGMPTIDAPLRIEGGNLLSNGAGLCMTTSKVIDDNTERGYDEREVTRVLKATYGANEVLLLEPLVGEPTGHVDMFATFTAADCVVVGEINPADDPQNAEILNRNADRLARVVTPRGPMRVLRIPMPPAEFDLWRTYTNVAYANGTLLVPVYPGRDRQGRRQAFAVFRRALPGWRVVGIDASDLIESGGALHCVTMNLARVARLPDSTPLDGRPDPIRQFPETAAEEGVIADRSGEADAESAPLAEPPEPHEENDERRGGQRWHAAANRIVAGSRPLFAGDDEESQLPARGRSRENVWLLDPPESIRGGRSHNPAWDAYLDTPSRLRDYDHKHRVSILRN